MIVLLAVLRDPPLTLWRPRGVLLLPLLLLLLLLATLLLATFLVDLDLIAVALRPSTLLEAVLLLAFLLAVFRLTDAVAMAFRHYLEDTHTNTSLHQCNSQVLNM